MKPVIVRLSARTFPMILPERAVLDTIAHELVEIEGERHDEILEVAPMADAVLVVATYLKGHVIAGLKQLKIISRAGTGTDKVDIDEATRQGVLVTNLPFFSTNEVADHTMALLLSAARRLKQHEKLVRTGQRPSGVLEMHRLCRQTLGIIGFGRIGRAVAARARGFGMKIIAFDPFVTKDQLSTEEQDVKLVDLDTVLTLSDFVTLLCPLSAQTRKMIAAPELKKMKSTAILVNTSRGELVDENDLADAIQSGTIRAAAIDVYDSINVFAEGGFATTHPYFSLEEEKLILTPHVAANSEETLVEAKVDAAKAVVAVLSGVLPNNICNPSVVPKVQLKRVLSH